MTAHVHAARMAEYAQDALETDEPWLRWVYRYGPEDTWDTMAFHPDWDVSGEYRRKPRTININGHEVPEPMREAPSYDTEYFLVTTAAHVIVSRTTWLNEDVEREWIARGLCHSTREAAEAHARALLSFTEVRS